MRAAFYVFLFSLSAAGLFAQDSSAAAAEGVTPEWDVRSNMSEMASDVRKLEPLLSRADAGEWVKKGASDTYVRQSVSADAAVKALITATVSLANRPERLTTALEAFFQMERTEMLLGSLRDGVRRYQSQDLANEFNHQFAAIANHRDRLRQHIRDLAELREQEFNIANQEAQRCRGMLTKQTAAERPPDRKRNQQHRK